MRVLFLNPPFKFRISRDSRWPEHTKSGTLYYCYWLSYAIGLMIKESDHKVLLLDAIVNDWDFGETFEKIGKFKPDLIVIETTTPTFKNDVKFAEEVKEKIKCKTCFVGTHVSALPTESLEYSKTIDFIAKKEFEYTILDLANSLENKKPLEKILGLSFRKGKKIIHNNDRPLIKNLDGLPFVSGVYKEFLDIKNYRYALARHPMIQIFSSRGCPNRCTFCQYPQVFSNHKFRARSPENFVNELEWIKQNLPEVKEIFIEDDTFAIDEKRVWEICDLIIERELKIIWSTNMRVNTSYKTLKKMKDAGCRIVIVGYESGNQKILNNVKKGTTIRQAEEFTKNCKKIGLRIFGCFMIGLPGETKDTIEQTFQFAKKLNPDMVFFQHAVPFPGTEFYEWCKKNNYLISNDWGDWLDKNGRLNFMINYPNLSAQDLKEIRDKLVLRYYLTPKNILQNILRNLHPSEMARFINVVKDYLMYLITK